MSDIFDKIENLQEKEEWYIITPFLEFPEGSYYDLELYLWSKYLDEFAKKICFIIMNALTIYKSENIYLTEFPEDSQGLKYVSLAYENLRDKTFEELDDIISYIIKKDVSSVEIYFNEIDCLISIDGHFQVVIYGDNKNFRKYLEKLTIMQGLFFKQVSEDDYIEDKVD